MSACSAKADELGKGQYVREQSRSYLRRASLIPLGL